jgi:hypothetical protein
MQKKKRMNEMNADELIELATHLDEARQKRNARRRARRAWLKNAPREETALHYHAEEKPCTIAQYLEVERFVLRWLNEFPDLKGDAVLVLLVLAHNILHLLSPEKHCSGTFLAECPSFTIHDLSMTAIEIGYNFRPDPAFHLKAFQIAQGMIELTRGVNQERLNFNKILDDITIDL